VHAILLAGGSAYGLDAATGVMRWLEEQGAGFDVQVAKVPIVSGAVLFDLPVGNARIRPDADMGYAACLAATRKAPATGNVGAGTGASVGKAAGMERAMKGGLGCCGLQAGGLKVGAVIAVNCLGDVLDPMTGKILAGTLSADRQRFAGSDNVLLQSIEHPVNLLTSNTTIGAVFTNAGLSKSQATKLASMAQCGLVRSIRPAHTMYDGDTIFALSLGETAADLNVLGVLAARAVELAVLNAVQAAKSLAGLACARDFQPR
jgi:L-aminopeptidase/D-esterase-like protein